jgi:[ribosomal protein S5]-alanine N-acetyltransferase
MNPAPARETARLKLRPYSDDDITGLLALIGVREVAATTLRIPYPYTEQARAFLAMAQEPYRIWLAITLRSDGRQIGGAGLLVDQQHHHAEFGYWLGVSCWEKATPPRLQGNCCVTAFKSFTCTAFLPHISSTIRLPAGS